MNCTETRDRLESFLNGELGGEESRRIRTHLASCVGCASALSGSDRIEPLTIRDESVEPSPDLPARFRVRLAEHRRRRAASGSLLALLRLRGWLSPRRLAAAGALVAVLVAALFLDIHRTKVPEPAANMNDIAVSENLPLLRDMGVVRNLELMEDFEVIQNLPPDGIPPSRNH